MRCKPATPAPPAAAPRRHPARGRPDRSVPRRPPAPHAPRGGTSHESAPRVRGLGGGPVGAPRGSLVRTARGFVPGEGRAGPVCHRCSLRSPVNVSFVRRHTPRRRGLEVPRRNVVISFGGSPTLKFSMRNSALVCWRGSSPRSRWREAMEDEQLSIGLYL